MKHLFVPYEIALQLKEKGFGLSEDDYLLWFAFYENGILNNDGIPEADIGRKYNPSPNHLGADTINDFEATVIMMDNSLDDICIAPLYQQVIDWFREEHNIVIQIDLFDYGFLESNLPCFQWRIFDKSDSSDTTLISSSESLNIYNMYNEAIEEALKLI